MTDDLEDLSKDELIGRIRELEQRLNSTSDTLGRRSLLRAAAVASLGAGGVLTASGTAAAASGTFPRETEPALVKLRADRVSFDPVTQDPSDADDGDWWFRGDL